MNKKYVKLILLSIFCMTACGGCESKQQVEEAQSEQQIVEIPVIFRADPTTNQSDNQNFVLEFNEAFADQYYMDAKWLTETTSGYRNKLKQWNALDEMPVLITDAGFDYDFYRMLAENDRLVDLRPWMEESDFWMDAMNEDVLADCTEEDGSIYLSPLGSSVHTYAGIIYNEELLRRAGYETFPTTWGEFWECLDSLEELGVTPLALHGSGSYWVPMLFASAYMYRTEEGREFLNQGFPESYQNEVMEDMLAMMRRIFTYSFADALDIDYDQAAQRFLNGEAAIIANGKWMFDGIPEEMRGQLRFAAFPEGIMMNSPRMGAWAVTAGYSEEVTEGAVKALEFRIKSEQEDMEEVLNGEESDLLAVSYGEA